MVKEAVAGRELVLAWSLRGAPHLFPPPDFAVFTLGARPADETLERLWGEPERALVDVEKAIVAVLGRTPMPKGEVSAAVTASVAAELAPWCAACEANHPKDSVFRAAPLLGRVVLTSTAPVLLTRARTWLGADAKGHLDGLRTELVRRFLHCYAPTTSGLFAEWAGITKSDAKQRWGAVADDLVAVRGERRGFVLGEDLEALEQPPASTGVRLVPAKDALLQARDRDLLFPDPAHRKAVYPSLGGPGVVLHEALPVGTWRGTAKGKRYQVKVTAFARLAKAIKADIETEAERVAHVRGHEAATVVVDAG